MRKSKKDQVCEWRRLHPQGRRCDLYNSDAGISKATVDRWWNCCDIADRPLSATEKVAGWRLVHPDSDDRKVCSAETGLSLRSVYLRWDPVSKSSPEEKENITDENPCSGNMNETPKDSDDPSQNRKENDTEPEDEIHMDENGQYTFGF